MKPAVETISIDSLALSTSAQWTATRDPRGVLSMSHPPAPTAIRTISC